MKETFHKSVSIEVDHLFRHESGKMIAVLTRIFGIHHLQLAEDVMQESFLKAMETWKFGGYPENPSAWLMQVAKNKALDILRKRGREGQYDAIDHPEEFFQSEAPINEFFHEQEIADSQLRMIFSCAHPSLKEEDQLALTLKIISGFSVQEIARALLSSADAIQKRIYRAREFIRQQEIRFEIPAGAELSRRLETVLSVVYLMFNEGYSSIKEDELIRKELCAEAMRLCKLLTEHSICNSPSANALLSLMCFHAARFESRLTEDNDIILLQDQDRTKWNRELIDMGYRYLNYSSSGEDITVYHIESAIAAEHCIARSFEETNWSRLLQLYDLLFQLKPSSTVQLNRAIVLAELNELENAINSILSIPNIEALLKTQYMYSLVLGDLYKRFSDEIKARDLLENAFRLTPSRAEKNLIQQKIRSIDPKQN